MTESSSAVLKWLQRQGYPLELRVGRAFREAGWQVEHGAWFGDPETHKLREIDLIVSRFGVAEESGPHFVSGESLLLLAIECKSSRAKPWVAFTSHGWKASPAFREFVAVDEYSRRSIGEANRQRQDVPSLFAPPETFAHGLAAAFLDSEDRERKKGDPTAPYAALRGAVSAATAYGLNEQSIALMKFVARSRASVCLPLVILDGELFEYSLGDSGEDRLEAVERTVVSTASPLDGSPVLVRVVTLEGLGSFVKELSSQAQLFSLGLARIAPIVARELYQRERNKDRSPQQ